MPWPRSTTVITCPGTTTTVAPSSAAVTVTWPERPAVILRWRDGVPGAGESLPGRGARESVTVTGVPGRGGSAVPVRPAAPPATEPLTPHAATDRAMVPVMTAEAVGTMRRFLARMSTWTRSRRVRFRNLAMCQLRRRLHGLSAPVLARLALPQGNVARGCLESGSGVYRARPPPGTSDGAPEPGYPPAFGRVVVIGGSIYWPTASSAVSEGPCSSSPSWTQGLPRDDAGRSAPRPLWWAPARCLLEVRFYQSAGWREAALAITRTVDICLPMGAPEPRTPWWPSWCPRRRPRWSGCGCTRLPCRCGR